MKNMKGMILRKNMRYIGIGDMVKSGVFWYI